MESIREFEVTEYGPEGLRKRTVSAIREVPLTIVLNGAELVTLLCTARYPEYLAVGFLKSDALISRKDQLRSVEIKREPGRIVARVATTHDPLAHRTIERTVTSGCGKGTNFGRNVETISRRRIDADLRVAPEQILAHARELMRRSTLYDETRGCHNSSLCTSKEMLYFREDIGRHNAIDMIVGQCFYEDVPTQDKMVVSTGRVASEILLKVARIGVPVLASTAVATSLSVELARQIGITLVGRVNDRAGTFWIYNDLGRIVGDRFEGKTA